MMTDLFALLLGRQLGGGGGKPPIKWADITANDDGTFTGIDTDGDGHTLSYNVNDDGKITDMSMDGATWDVTYDDDGNITAVGDVTVDFTGWLGSGDPINIL